MCSQYLQVEIPKLLCAENEFRIEITWKTDARCSAIQWLLPLQTFSKSHPYVYTQLQAIHARSLFPCLDSPSFKCSYSAVIDLTECPGMKAVMSAQRKASPSDRVFEFSQPIPIPVTRFLFLLAVELFVCVCNWEYRWNLYRTKIDCIWRAGAGTNCCKRVLRYGDVFATC